MISKLSIFFVILLIAFTEVKGQPAMNMRYELEPTTIKLLNTVFPIVECTLNSKKAYFLIDTGSTITVLDLSQKKGYGFFTHKRLSKELYGFGGKHLGVWSVLDVNLKIGGRFVATPFLGVSLSQLKESISKRTGYTITGIIGSDVIRDYGIIIDFVGERCIVGVGKNMVEKILIGKTAEK